MSIAKSGIGVLFFSILLGVIVAIGSGLFELAFLSIAHFLHQPAWLNQLGLPIWVVYLCSPLLAAPIIIYLLNKIPEKRQYNPSDIIASIHTYNGKISIKSCFISIIASIFSLGFGYSTGHYSPTVQLGALVGHLMFRFKKIRPLYIHISIGAGVAAGIAAIFHTPIAAVVFVHEVLFRFFSIRAFAPITISAVTSYIVSAKLFGKDVVLLIPEHFQPEPFIYVGVAFAAIIAALIGVAFIKSVLSIQKMSNKHSWSIHRKIIIAAVLTGVIGVYMPEIMGNSQAILKPVLSSTSHFSLQFLFLLIMAKFIATVLSTSMGVPGGIFGPAIFFGAILGSLISDLLTFLFPEILADGGIIVITTMAALASSVMGAPISMILIIIEITHDYNVTSAVMLAVVIANVTSYRFMGMTSFFDMQLKSRGLDMDSGRDKIYMQNRDISDLISSDLLVLQSEMTIVEARDNLQNNDKNRGYIIDAEANYIGHLLLTTIEFSLKQSMHSGEQNISGLINEDSKNIIYRDSSIWQAVEMIEQINENYIIVLDSKSNPKLLGVIDEKDILHTYFETIQLLRQQEKA